MSITTIDFFYDGQIRRFLLQVVRAFSGFQYESRRADGTTQLKLVPCRMATQNKQVATILRNNSENSLLSAPMITVFIKDMEINRDRTQAPGFVSSVQVHEREVDPATGEYTGESGSRYTVDRMMPHPLDAHIQVDIWTTNEMMKHQLFEQIFMAFNVGFDIQSSDNPIDWSAMTTLTLDGISWTSRSMPIGTSDEMDIMSFTFKLPMWISPPAKVKQQTLIHQIMTNIRTGDNDPEDTIDGRRRAPIGDMLVQNIESIGNYRISVLGDEITLLGNEDGVVPSWAELLAQYGTISPAHTQLRLRADIEQDDALDIAGTVQLHASKPNVLFWQIDTDTLPGNTIPPVLGIINPLLHFPGRELPHAAFGQRYLILGEISPSLAWGPTINAGVGDIVEYGVTGWTVVLSAANTTAPQYVVNQRSGKQLRLQNHSWILAIDGEYNPGYWRIYL